MIYGDPHRYDDIMELEHPVSKRHQRMSLHDRAAQFAPFAALTGYGDMVDRQSRRTAEEYEEHYGPEDYIDQI